MSPLYTPPSPKGQFLVGHLYDFMRDRLTFLSHCAHEYGDIVRLNFGPFRLYLLNHPSYVEGVLEKNSHLFIKNQALRTMRLFLGRGLLLSEGSVWQHQRHVIQPAFAREHLATYAEVIVESAVQMVSEWSLGEVRNIHEKMLELTVSIAAKAFFGTSLHDQTAQISAILTVGMRQFIEKEKFLYLLPDCVPTLGNLRYRKAAAQLDKIVSNIIRQRRCDSQTHNDLLALLLADFEHCSINDETQLRDQIITFLLAGHETTASALSWTCFLLAQHPSIAAQVSEEIDIHLDGQLPQLSDLSKLVWTRYVILEAMRLYPPAWLLGRQAVGDCELNGHSIQAGDTVLMSQWVMHRDSRFFSQPDQFLPQRWANNLLKTLPKYAYFPFGGGSRVCVGQSFAMLEITLILVVLIQRFQLQLLPDPPVELYPSLTLRPKYGIKVRLSRSSYKKRHGQFSTD